MIADYTDGKRAEGKVRLCLGRLAGEYPFHSRVLEQFHLVERPGVGTLGVTVAGGGVSLLFAPAFVLATPADQLVGALLHEVHHVVLGHVLADPADFPDAWARAVAEEVTVNEFIREPLPEGALTLERFPGLPPGESTAQRYARLRVATPRAPFGQPGIGAEAGGIGGPQAPRAGKGACPGADPAPDDDGTCRRSRLARIFHRHF